MDDFTYDIVQKKRIAHGAKHMKRGSKSRKCSLPSDHLTPAQLKRRNGPVSTYKMDAPMRWDEFKAMPIDLQINYLKNLQDLYSANDKMFGQMFHIHFTHFARYRTALGVPPIRERLKEPEKEIRDNKWCAFCNGVVGGGDAPTEETVKLDPLEEPTPVEDYVRFDCEESAELAEKMIQEPLVPADAHPMFVDPLEPLKKVFAKSEKTDELGLTDLTATFKGEFNPERFLHWITKLPMPDGQVKIRVEVTAE